MLFYAGDFVEIGLVVFWVTVVGCSSAVLVTLLVACLNIRFIRKETDKKNTAQAQALHSFLSAKADQKTGGDFVRLVALGFFTALKTNNHSKNFDEREHLKYFRKNLTPENTAAIRRIGEIYGQYHI